MDAVKTAIEARLKELVGAEVIIFANQNAPRPPSPYWTMRLSVGRKVGRDQLSQGVTAQGDQTVAGAREITLQVQRIGTGSVSAMEDLRDNLSKTSVVEKWFTSKLSVYDMGEVQDLTTLLDAQLEERASLDLFIRFGTKLLDNVGIVETVATAADFDGKVDLAETIAVVL